MKTRTAALGFVLLTGIAAARLAHAEEDVRRLARDVFHQLIEIDTTESTGSTSGAAPRQPHFTAKSANPSAAQSTDVKRNTSKVESGTAISLRWALGSSRSRGVTRRSICGRS